MKTLPNKNLTMTICTEQGHGMEAIAVLQHIAVLQYFNSHSCVYSVQSLMGEFKINNLQI